MFKITSNKLTGNNIIKSITFNNDIYELKFSYIGDYMTDKQNHTLHKDSICVDCTINKNISIYMPTINKYDDTFLFDMTTHSLLNETELIEFQKCITDAITSKNEIEKLFLEYFPTENITSEPSL